MHASGVSLAILKEKNEKKRKTYGNHLPRHFWSSFESLNHYQVKIYVTIKWSHKSPPIILTTEFRMVDHILSM